jgi:Arc/MetJ family transcription regulator
VAEGLLNDLRLKCIGENACALLWTTYSGETCWELERLLDVGGDDAEFVLVNAINRPKESLVLLRMYVAVLGKMGAWNALRKMVCNRADEIPIRIACLATLLDNSELSVLAECVESGSEDEFAPFVWDALRRSVGLDEARSLALRTGLQPIELEDVEVIHSRLLTRPNKIRLQVSGSSVNRCLVRIAAERPDLLSRLDTRLISRFDLARVQRAFETSGYEEMPQYRFDTRRDLADLRIEDVIAIDDTDEARPKLIGLASCPEADDVTKVLAVSALCNYGAVEALGLITKHSTVTSPVRAAAHERLTRIWTLWANRLRMGLQCE